MIQGCFGLNFDKRKGSPLEVKVLFSTVLGGELLEEILRAIFHRLGPLGTAALEHSKYTFPSEQALMAVVTYGFAGFLIIRYLNRHWIGTFIFISALVLCIFSGLGPIFFNYQYPSDVAAGYVFGGVWLSMNIVLLEVLRILPNKANTII